MTNAQTFPPVIVGPDEGEAVWFGASRITILATGEQTGGAYGGWISRAAAGAGPPLHLHRGVDEAFWIAQGTVRFVIDERQFTLGPGGYVLLPREVPHTFYVEGPDEAVMFGLLSPGGSERYFAKAGRPAETDGLPPAGPPDMARMNAAGRAFGIEIVGPPLRPTPADQSPLTSDSKQS